MIENFNHEEFFQNKYIEYINIVLDAIEGEKDPRNILLMFNLVKLLNKSIPEDLNKIYAKNFFEILDVYYPIEFVPPKNSPDKITSEDLIDTLNDCFASNEFYFEFLIEVIKDKISSIAPETKIQVLKTIRKINEKYSLYTLKIHFIPILNLILQQILNNEDEYLHIESLITFKEMVKRFCDEIKDKIYESLDESENHILVNLDKIFEKSEDLLFNSENIKNSYDAKDLIVVLVEFADIHNLNFRERALKVSMKLINTFLNTNKLTYLKNANSILFFVLKKTNTDINLQNAYMYLQNNHIQIKNTIQNLMKKYSNNSEVTETIIDVVTCFIVKVDTMFTEDETTELFNKIFSTWRECESSIENHIGICLNEIIIKFEKLNNLDFILKLIQSQIKECYQTENYEPVDLTRFFNLLQHYFSNSKLSNGIIQFCLNSFSELFCFINENYYTRKSENLEQILFKLTELLINIFEKNSVIFTTEAELFYKFLESLFKNISSISVTSYKNVSKIIKIIIKEIEMKYCDDLLIFIINLNKNKIGENDNNNNYSNESEIKTVPSIIVHLKIQKFIISKKININSKNYDAELFNQLCELYVSQIKSIEHLGNYKRIFNIIEKISINLGLVLYKINKNILSFSINDDSKNDLNRISEKIKNSFNLHFENLNFFLNNTTDIEVDNFKKNLIFCSIIINYMILYNDINFSSICNKLLEIFSSINSENLLNIIENSKLLKFDKNLFIESEDKDSIYQILSILKDFNQKFSKENLTIPKNITITLLCNIYSRFNDEELDENADIILNLCVRSLESHINLKTASSLMKRMLKYIDRDFARKRGYDVKSLIYSIINIIKITDDIQIKLDLFSCLYKFKLSIPGLDTKLANYISKKLKPILNDQKRIVRKFCGMVINIWTMNE